MTLAPYLALVRELSAALAPVQPRPAFRAELARSLAAAARQQRAQDLLAIEPAQAQPQSAGMNLPRAWHGAAGERWLIGAAAIGSALSLAGIVAYLVHRRERTRSAA